VIGRGDEARGAAERARGWVPVGLAVALAVGGCPGPKGERGPAGPLAGVAITFAISLAEDEKDAVREALARFSRDTGASVTMAAVSGEDLPEKLKVEVRAGRPTIDLFARTRSPSGRSSTSGWSRISRTSPSPRRCSRR
jgi:hypothetical protein